jgi:hypothetical protein
MDTRSNSVALGWQPAGFARKTDTEPSPEGKGGGVNAGGRISAEGRGIAPLCRPGGLTPLPASGTPTSEHGRRHNL